MVPQRIIVSNILSQTTDESNIRLTVRISKTWLEQLDRGSMVLRRPRAAVRAPALVRVPSKIMVYVDKHPTPELKALEAFTPSVRRAYEILFIILCFHLLS